MLGYGFVLVAFTSYVLYPALPFFVILFTPQRFLRIVAALLAISLLFLLFKNHTPDCDEITGRNVFALPQLNDIGFWFFSVLSLIFGLSTRFVWLLRSDKIVFNNWLSKRVFQSYDDIVDHCCHAWQKLIDQPWKIMSIGLREWAHGF